MISLQRPAAHLHEWASAHASVLRHTLRALLRVPGVMFGAPVMIAIGVGATTSAYAVVDALYLRAPGGLRAAEELARLFVVRDEGMIRTPRGGGGSYVDYQVLLQARVSGAQALAAFRDPEQADLGLGPDARQVLAQVVSENFFTALGVRLTVGRAFVPTDDARLGGGAVAVISHGLWRVYFGEDSSVVGRALELNGRQVVVVGVADRSFRGMGVDEIGLWVPMSAATAVGLSDDDGGDWRENPFTASVMLVARIAPGASAEIVASQAEAALRRAAHPDLDSSPRVVASSLAAASGPSRSDTDRLALLLLVMTGLIFGMVLANLTNLFLVRAMSRRREIATRMALGATLGQVVRAALVENVALAVGGSGLALMLVQLSARLARSLPIPAGDGRPPWRVLAVALLVAGASATLPALLSAHSAWSASPWRWLRGIRGTSPSARGHHRALLVGMQAAMASLLLVGALLFARSMGRLASVDPGVDIGRLLVGEVALVRAGYAPTAREALYVAARQALLQTPGIEQVAIARFAPLGGLPYSTDVRPVGRSDFEARVSVNWVEAGYFDAVGQSVRRGRALQGDDRYGSALIVVVNERLARDLSTFGEVLGMCLEIPSQAGPEGCVQVVGVVEDARSTILDADIVPTAYLPWAQYPAVSSAVDGSIVVRAGAGAEVSGTRVRQTLSNLDPRLPFVQMQALSDRLRPELLHLRVGVLLFSVLGAIAAVVAGMGVYSLVTWVVQERLPEFAIRQALGATRSDIVGLVLRISMVPVFCGAGIGLALAYAGGPLLDPLLFEVRARDLAVFATAVAFLGTATLLACLWPALRASSNPPMASLRHE